MAKCGAPKGAQAQDVGKCRGGLRGVRRCMNGGQPGGGAPWDKPEDCNDTEQKKGWTPAESGHEEAAGKCAEGRAQAKADQGDAVGGTEFVRWQMLPEQFADTGECGTFAQPKQQP